MACLLVVPPVLSATLVSVDSFLSRHDRFAGRVMRVWCGLIPGRLRGWTTAVRAVRISGRDGGGRPGRRSIRTCRGRPLRAASTTSR